MDFDIQKVASGKNKYIMFGVVGVVILIFILKLKSNSTPQISQQSVNDAQNNSTLDILNKYMEEVQANDEKLYQYVTQQGEKQSLAVSSLESDLTTKFETDEQQDEARLQMMTGSFDTKINTLTTKYDTNFEKIMNKIDQSNESINNKLANYNTKLETKISNNSKKDNTTKIQTSNPVTKSVSTVDPKKQATTEIFNLKDMYTKLQNSFKADGSISKDEQKELDKIHNKADVIAYNAGLQSSAKSKEGEGRTYVY